MENKIGKKIKDKREQKGWTQIYLAEQLSFPDSSYISKIESGKRNITPEEAVLFAQIFNCSVHELLGKQVNDGEVTVQHVNDDDALEYLDELHKRPEMKTLFQVSRKATKQDIETATTLIEALKRKSRGED